MLRDLRIENYRSFKNFQTDGLAQVNLFVGANNSGKTSLLEAIYLLVNQNSPQCMAEILSNRGEIAERYVPSRISNEFVRSASGYQIEHIFHGHKSKPAQIIRLRSKKDRRISLEIELQDTKKQNRLLQDETTGSDEDPSTFVLQFSYGPGKDIEIPARDDGSIEMRSFRLISREPYSHRFLTTDNLDFSQLGKLWDGITLTPKEESVIQALQILEPSVERISFTSRQTSNTGILLKLGNQQEPVPLGSMGDGMRRILTLAASAVMAEGGVLLVDEIDTGLYYRTQADMWRLLIRTAKNLNLQIFATTHSLDCVRAFQESINTGSDGAIGKLFRLSLRDSEIKAIPYTADELTVAIEQEIEVR